MKMDRTYKYMLTYFTGKNFAGDTLHIDKFCRDHDDLMKTIYFLIDIGELLLPTKISVWDYELKHPVIFFNTN